MRLLRLLLIVRRSTAAQRRRSSLQGRPTCRLAAARSIRKCTTAAQPQTAATIAALNARSSIWLSGAGGRRGQWIYCYYFAAAAAAVVVVVLPLLLSFTCAFGVVVTWGNT